MISALKRKNVSLHTKAIERFNEEGVIVRDQEDNEAVIDLDLVILATGFDVLASVKPFLRKGRPQQTLENIWNDHPQCFAGVLYPGMY